MNFLHRIYDIFFPAKCILCQKTLRSEETDICRKCRAYTEEFPTPRRKISFVARWASMWYYNDDVRYSMLRFKFYRMSAYGQIYGRLLAMYYSTKPLCDYDILTWVPISNKRKNRRGFDQVELIAVAMGQELGTPATPTLKKIRHTKKQSYMQSSAHRKANVLGAYTVLDPKAIAGKRILLIDDIITTGSTISECARVLLTAGAKEVSALCVASNNK